ncbi:hypothetical protein BDN70DRAFT_872915 [Pholiota conissans]|uniref:F-box domain-containing protein n=1 Tax=Pholiota conissans TaxID=109636 RepID=A0A9P5ZB72_9AGAR|nr:hypothetical protein BDN70DRAFT_872915 [Pholiota conissans]
MPYDVLNEIFIQCLSQYPLASSNTYSNSACLEIAPMVLCRVCSTWRAVAVTSPILWSHMSYRVTVTNINTESGSQWAVRKIDFDAILWWKNNQGEMPPNLRLMANIYEGEDSSDHDMWTTLGMSVL